MLLDTAHTPKTVQITDDFQRSILPLASRGKIERLPDGRWGIWFDKAREEEVFRTRSDARIALQQLRQGKRPFTARVRPPRLFDLNTAFVQLYGTTVVRALWYNIQPWEEIDDLVQHIWEHIFRKKLPEKFAQDDVSFGVGKGIVHLLSFRLHANCRRSYRRLRRRRQKWLQAQPDAVINPFGLCEPEPWIDRVSEVTNLANRSGLLMTSDLLFLTSEERNQLVAKGSKSSAQPQCSSKNLVANMRHVMGKDCLTTAEIVDRLLTVNLLPNCGNPTSYINHVLARQKRYFVRVRYGLYKVINP